MIGQKEALQGTRKILSRRGKRLQVNIPAGVRTGSVVKLSNARQITDGLPGDILVQIVVK
jgi:DnaJ-class molecular chaperone